MNIVPFDTSSVPAFLELAAREGWLVAPWELDYLLAVFPEGCWQGGDASGQAAAFVTAIRHERSGWIGNLIVASAYRGGGVGAALFEHALEALMAAGCETIWLTASEKGRGIYERRGFRRIDTILRRRGAAHCRIGGFPEQGGALPEHCTAIDAAAWGDRRHNLLTTALRNGSMLCSDGGFAGLQPVGGTNQLGPFLASNGSIADTLLRKAMAVLPEGVEYFVDTPAGNRTATRLYNRRKMNIIGRTELMFAGKRPEYRPELIFGLATMGSCG